MESLSLDRSKLAEIVERHRGRPGALLGILEEAQKINKWSYLPEDVLNWIAKETGTPPSRVYSIVTFYSFFNLKPQGINSVIVCRGTACHTRGSKAILEDALRLLDIDASEDEEGPWTTGNKLFSVRTVACFGQCALAPVVAVNGVIYSRVTSANLALTLKKIAKGGKK